MCVCVCPFVYVKESPESLIVGEQLQLRGYSFAALSARITCGLVLIYNLADAAAASVLLALTVYVSIERGT